ncbi:c-type cytochrome [Campylobacter ureolyticus]|uniref:c-type cytochrome n=1 Tax=Campylobacter ureolyticus TaxID=827 RepID=UPI0004689FA1|nr:c-type cytochrome [Campylobacter ureolyticus]QIX86367.1 c-type cytochrome [Campylobacter ureolyticus]STA69835.1 glutamate racemase 2 [Campylobacter ureolyticus]
MRFILACFISLFLLGCSNDSKKTYEKTQDAQTENEVKSNEVKDNEAKNTVETSQTNEKITKNINIFNGKSVDEYFDLKCASCHGRYGEKSALKASKIINELDENQIKADLMGYKNDINYGGNLKATMHRTASELSDDEINALAKFISTL